MKRTHLRFVQTLLLVLMASSQVQAAIVADSVAEFSGTQGQNNWFYGYYSGALTPSTFNLLPQYNVSPRPNTWVIDPAPPTPFFYTGIDAVGGHGNGDLSSSNDVIHWAVRRWVAETSGLVTISGNIADLDVGAGGNGIMGRVYYGSSEIYNQVISEGNSGGVNYSFTFSIAAGTPIDFVIDPIGNNDLFDSSRFTALVTLDLTSVPEPTGLLLTAVGSLVAFRRSRNRRA